MSEDIYGMLKRRFPIIKYSRVNLENSVKLAMAAVVLHNIALDWGDEEPTDPSRQSEDDEPQHDSIVLNQLGHRERRQRAIVVRDNWRATMDPLPTARESQRMADHRVQAEIR